MAENPQKTYYMLHREELLEKAKQRYRQNREEFRKYNAQYYEEHRDPTKPRKKRGPKPKSFLAPIEPKDSTKIIQSPKVRVLEPKIVSFN